MTEKKIKTNYNMISYLRILAWFLILRGHYLSLFTVPDALKKGIILGAGPVVIFFVISGFLTYHSLEYTGKKEYYIRRAWRIMPPYYIILLCALLYNTIVKSGFNVLAALRYFTFTNMLLPSNDFEIANNIYGFWTMSCFGVFYILAPFLMRLIQKFNKTHIIVIASVFVMLISRFAVNFAFGNKGYDNVKGMSIIAPFSVLYLFMLGMCVAHEVARNNQKGMLLFLGTFLLAMLILEQQGYVLWGCVTALLLLTPSFECRLEKNRIWEKIINFLDRNSFQMYLIHLLIADIWTHFFGTTFRDMIVCVVLTLILGELLTRISECFVKASRRIR